MNEGVKDTKNFKAYFHHHAKPNTEATVLVTAPTLEEAKELVLDGTMVSYGFRFERIEEQVEDCLPHTGERK